MIKVNALAWFGSHAYEVDWCGSMERQLFIWGGVVSVQFFRKKDHSRFISGKQSKVFKFVQMKASRSSQAPHSFHNS